MGEKTARAIEDTANREIVITRLLDAPREMVFDAWTDPQQLVQWWGPRGFSTTIQEIDVRAGGHWRMVMHGPDGRDYENHIVFIEVARPERLIYKHEPQHGTEPVRFETMVTFEAQGNKTRVTLRMLFPTAEQRDHAEATYHAIQGGEETLGRLAEHLSASAVSGRDAPALKTLELVRVFDAPRDLVFAAWTDPKQVAQWWGPRGFTNPVCELDVRTGGSILIHMRGPDGTVFPMTGEYREVVPPERIIFASSALDAEGQPMFEVLTTLTFVAQGNQTKLTMNARVLRAVAAAAPHLQGMDQGWGQTLDRLGEFLKNR
jgi:uncharacterized protein YndB with AHSA1/START domain